MIKSRITTGLLLSFGAALTLFVIGVVGFMLIEKFTLIESVYMTIITLSTVGFGEVRPLSHLGKLFTSGIIMMGVIIIAVMFGTLTEYVVAGELEGTLKLRRVMKKVNALRDHFIVCGFGRVGEQVAVELQNQGYKCLVVDNDRELIGQIEQAGILGIAGDATLDSTLHQAGIEHARGLVASLNSDADNLYVILSARKLKPDLIIVGRSSAVDAEEKLVMAGADRVVSPYNMAGHRIVNQLIRPHVTLFLDNAMNNKGLDLMLDEIQIAADSTLVLQNMGDADIRSRTGATILSILRGEDHHVIDWAPELAFEEGDILIVVGTSKEIRSLAELAKDTPSDA